MTYTNARRKYHKHHLIIADEKDVNLEKLVIKIGEFDFFVNGSLTLDKAYSELYNLSESKKANIAVIESMNHSLKGVLYFYPKLEVYSNKEVFKKGIIGFDNTNENYSFVKRHEYSGK